MPEISYRWISVEIAEGVPFEFSDSAANAIRQLPQKPAVYRWAVYENNVLRKIYIGEAGNFRRRVYQYFHPGQKQQTNIRLNANLKSDSEAGLTVRLEVLQVDPIYLNNIRISDGAFSDQYIRKMMENFTLADSDVTQYKILNATENPIERRKRKAQRDNPLEALFQRNGLNG